MNRKNRIVCVAIMLLLALSTYIQAAEPFVVPLRESYSGGRYISAQVDGVDVNFIFDTGCTSLFVNRQVFNELVRKGVVKRSDLSKANEAELANGASHMVRSFIIKRLQIGDCVLHNIRASVGVGDQSNAACLLGQTVLERFAYYSVAGNKLYFEPKPDDEQQALFVAESLSDDTSRIYQERIVEILRPYVEWLSPKYLVIYAYALYRTDEHEQAIAIFKYLLEGGEFEDSDNQLRHALEKVL